MMMPLENHRSRYKSVILGLLLVMCLGTPGHSERREAGLQATRSAGASPARRAKLVLVITVDQFRYDFLERFGGLFGPLGFRRLTTQGAFFTSANYDYVPTYTAPGHAAPASATPASRANLIRWRDLTSRATTVRARPTTAPRE